MKKIIFISFITLIVLSSCEKKADTLFTQVNSDHSNITFNNTIVETDSFNILTSEYIFNGGGIAVGDFNNDSKPDLFFTGNQVANKLYLNQGDFQFKDISKKAGIEAIKSWKTGVAVVDINSDGFLDVYVCAAMYTKPEEKTNMLFVNQGLNQNGEPTFKELAKEYGIADAGNSMNATFFDYDKDGLLDLYVLNNVDIHELPSNYREKITDGSALSNDRLYRNNGDNTFTDVTLEAGITIEGYGLGLAIADLNYDGWPDIYVSNDYLTNDILYTNNGDGTFSNTIDKVIKHQSKFSMGSDISDYNNDGFLDIITIDMLGETNYRLKTTVRDSRYNDYNLNEKFGYGYQYMRNMLHVGQGLDVPFSEVGLMAGVSRTDWSWSPLFVDVDNDGAKDLLITNGFPRDITDLDFGEFNFNVRRFLSPSQILDSIPVVKIPNYSYKNEKNGLFSDAGKEWGLNIPSFSNGAVFADLDGDGDMDYVVNNINEEAFVFKNNLNTGKEKKNNYVTIKLQGPRSNASGIGAKIVVRSEDGSFQYQEHYLTRGYMSSVQDIVHFGLGNTKSIASIEVVWPDGKFQQIKNTEVNKKIDVNYENASSLELSKLSFPLIQKELPTIYKEVSKAVGIDYVHQEQDKVDYNLQRILPHKLTQNGPCLATGDINGDGTEDFIVGSASGFSPVIFLQNQDGTFVKSQLFKDDKNKEFEEEGIALFDLENDGDLDLYLVSGSNEFDKESPFYTDRLFINDESGNFSMTTDKMPKINSSGSVVKAHDFDGDGFVDLFIGGRTPFANYPLPENSYLLKNSGGTLENVTDSYCPQLHKIGMVTDATWADMDKDGLADLIVTGEFMPITIFKNEKSKFVKFKETGLDSLTGWWESMVTHDFDNDGDLDLIVGNLGSNNIYQPSKDRPVTLLSKDFDNNGTVDPVMFAYIKDNFNDQTYRSFPINFWGDLSGQSPMFRAKFDFYREYAETTQAELFSPKELEGALEMNANHDKTSYFENVGNGGFKYHQLPLQAQVAPINRILTTDYDGDNNADLLMIGNNYGNEVFVGRYDAFNGGLLKGDGTGDFKFINTLESGFKVSGDAKDMITVKNASGGNPFIIVSQNRGKINVFQQN
ncbi:VCBS repeat-containing protein [Zobellia alginiliquefaciens]|uniref:VCBS repeat-containing protein n=1 Tax=Zobellia alginiliquefaciens TaxID=3032586 RepID=UPI0023E44851|nr:VCBS repeat-containing protein [Zobellia alginiliquefaciens]